MTVHQPRVTTGAGRVVELTTCPDCGAPAEILERFTLDSTIG